MVRHVFSAALGAVLLAASPAAALTQIALFYDAGVPDGAVPAGEVVGVGTISFTSTPSAGVVALGDLTDLEIDIAFDTILFDETDIVTPDGTGFLSIYETPEGFGAVFTGDGETSPRSGSVEFLNAAGFILSHEPLDGDVFCCGGDGVVNNYFVIADFPTEPVNFLAGEYASLTFAGSDGGEAGRGGGAAEVPLPAAGALLGGAALALAGLGRRRRAPSA